MNLTEAKNRIENLMWDHGLHTWQFKYDRALNRRGQTHYGTRTIQLSKHFVELNEWSRVRLTALHEIAHALVGPDHSHDKEWQAMCASIGGVPVKCTDTVVQTQNKQHRFTGSCKCRSDWVAHRLGKRLLGGVCTKCRQHILWFDSVEKTTIQRKRVTVSASQYRTW